MEPVPLTVVDDELEAETLCGLLRTDGIACSFRRTDLAAGWPAERPASAWQGRRRRSSEPTQLDAARWLLPPG